MKRIFFLGFISLFFIGQIVAQDKNFTTVQGTVISESDGLPLPGANIQVKNTSIGTVTDLNGKFKLKI